MTTKVAQMTADELREMIVVVVEQKFNELFGDPDEGLVMTKSLQNRLIRQKKAIAKGERGEAFEDVVARLGLA